MKYFIIILISALVLQSAAQTPKVVRDLKLKSEIGLKKDIFRNMFIVSSLGLELQKNASSISKYYGEFGLGYVPCKFFDVGLDYRLANKRQYFRNEYIASKRLGMQLEGHSRFRKLKISIRVRYQTIDDDVYDFELDEPNKNLIRTRVKLSSKLPETKISPIISGEYYLNTNMFSPLKYKFTSGVKYSIKKAVGIVIYYRLERNLVKSYRYCFNTIGIQFKFKI